MTVPANGDAAAAAAVRPGFFDACLFESLHVGVDASKAERMAEAVRVAAAGQARAEAEARSAHERLREAMAKSVALQTNLARHRASMERELAAAFDARVAESVAGLQKQLTDAAERAADAERQSEALRRREEQMVAAVIADAEEADAEKQVAGEGRECEAVGRPGGCLLVWAWLGWMGVGLRTRRERQTRCSACDFSGARSAPTERARAGPTYLHQQARFLRAAPKHDDINSRAIIPSPPAAVPFPPSHTMPSIQQPACRRPARIVPCSGAPVSPERVAETSSRARGAADQRPSGHARRSCRVALTGSAGAGFYGARGSTACGGRPPTQG